MDNQLEEIFELLEYHPKWVEFDLLTPEFFLAQKEQYDLGEDQNTEHYRWAAFNQIFDLKSRSTILDTVFDQFMFLLQVDPDISMAIAALNELIGFKGLSKHQLNQIKANEYFWQHKRVQKFTHQVELRHELLTSPLTDSLIKRVLEHGFTQDHNKIIGHPKISLQQLTKIAESGWSKRIRNLAKERLNSKKHRPLS